ncbi:hypothetical protein CAEBREN_22353 [Caenorhabditis brenneri]|uniref:Galectin domain-containing protein n=1 Tax=Caenorhabditis brenneri TaxID=135651 RepID=G0PAX4_CAEBE|nr:hypothetical protein CAEBREN_22353 [Caenorhabditis brenneri]
MMVFVLFLILASFPQFSQSKVTTYVRDGEIVFNSYMKTKWSIEEKLGFETVPPKILRISIKLLEDKFKVTINKQLKVFYHRFIIVAGPMRVFFLGQLAIDKLHVVEKHPNGPVSNTGRDRTAPKTVKERSGAKTKTSQTKLNTTMSIF